MYKRCGEGDLGLISASLEARQFDFVKLRGGTYEGLAFARRRASTRKREAFFVDFTEMVNLCLLQDQDLHYWRLRACRRHAQSPKHR